MINKGLTNNIRSLAIDPSDSRIIYAGTYDTGVFKSTNMGDDWTESNQGLTNKRVLVVAIDPSNPKVVYAGTGGGVFKSVDEGKTWKVFGYGEDSTDPIQALAIGPSKNPMLQTVCAGTPKGIFKFRFNDYGSGYFYNSNRGIPTLALAVTPSDSQIIYAGTDGRGVFKSENGGISWTDTRLRTTKGDSSIHVYALAVDPLRPKTVYAGTEGEGVFKSTNGGNSWIAMNNGLTDKRVRALAIDPLTPETVYAGTGGGGVFKSKDGGSSWTAVNSGLLDDNPIILSLAIDPSNPQRVYAGARWGGAFVITFSAPPPRISIAIPGSKKDTTKIFLEGTNSKTLTATLPVTIKDHKGYWQWQLDKPFPPSGPAGGNKVISGNIATITGLKNGQTYTVYAALVDSNDNVLKPSVVDSFKFIPTELTIISQYFLVSVKGKDGNPIQTFNTPLTLSLKVKEEDLAQNGFSKNDKDKVKIYRLNEDSQFWLLEGGTLDSAKNNVQTKISQAGVYALGIEQTIVKNKDTTPPRIWNPTPPDGGTIKIGSTLSVQIVDEGGAGLDLASVKIQIDGKDINALYNHETQTLSYTLPDSLASGLHSIRAFAKDLAGNESGWVEWKFILRTPIPEDFNGDGKVDLEDFFAFAVAFGQKAIGDNLRFDLDGDGNVGLEDFFIFVSAFGKKI